jgi:hypothetical protein
LEDAMNDATGAGGPTEGSAAEKTQEKAQEVAGQAQEKVGEAAQNAQETIRRQVDERSTQAGERVGGTADDLRGVGEELRKQGKDGPAKLADRAAEQTEKVGSYLSGTGPDQMLHDAEDFGRERPWALLGGGLVLGAVAARFLKASSRGRHQERSRAGSSSAERQIATPSVTQPPSPPRESAEPTGVPVAAGSSVVGS